MQISQLSSQVTAASNQQQQRPANEEFVVREHPILKRDPAPKQITQPSPQEFLKKIEELTDGGTRSVRFEMDNELKMLVVKIFNNDTNELVRQVPSESLLGTTKALQEFRRGLVVDDKT